MKKAQKRFIGFLRSFCVFAALLIVLSSLPPVFASVVKVPVFAKVPSDSTYIAGTRITLSTRAKIFGDSTTELRYSLEVMRKTVFLNASEYFTGISGESVDLEVTLGKGNSPLLNHGVYTARIRAASIDGNGGEIAVAYSPVFELTVLPPVIKTVAPDYDICYGDEFFISAEINSYYSDDAEISLQWKIKDGVSWHTIGEGECINGIEFRGVESSFLRIYGTPEKIFTLTFALCASVDGAVEPQPSKEFKVEFRPEIITGFSLGNEGMRFFNITGRYVTGWLKHEGSVYYFDSQTGIMATGLKIVDGKRCFFGADGRLLHGFTKTPLGYRYFEDGRFVTGWITIDGTECYFEDYTGYMTAKMDSLTGEIIYFSDYGSRGTTLSAQN